MSDEQRDLQKERELIESGAPVTTDVFVSGQEGYHTYRDPSVVATKAGTVLVFCEGRATQADHAHNKIVLKRSMDGGASWYGLQTIADAGDDCLNNATSLILESGRVLLMYQKYKDGFDEHDAAPGYTDDAICRTYTIYSDDDGKTWSAPGEITRQVKREAVVTSVAVGPGVGIQLRRGEHRGRIIMPFNQGPYGQWRVYAVYSDDGGKSWEMGELAPEESKGMANEVQMVERSDGSIYLNARSMGGRYRRKTAVSDDGGQTWSGLKDDPALIEPQCMGSVIRYSDPLDGKKNRILFSNPAALTQRVNGTVRLSYDDGATWPVAKTIRTGKFDYSCLGVLKDGDLVCAYGTGELSRHEKIHFTRFSLAWLTGGRDWAEV